MTGNDGSDCYDCHNSYTCAMMLALHGLARCLSFLLFLALVRPVSAADSVAEPEPAGNGVQTYKSPVGLLVSKDGKSLFAAAEESNTLISVNLATQSVEWEIPVGEHPFWIAESPDKGEIYVSNRWSASVSVADRSARKVVRTIRVGNVPSGLEFSRDGRILFVANSGSDDISVIDTRLGAEVKRLVAGRTPTFLALTPDGQRLYVTNVLSRPVPYGTPSAPELTVIDAVRQTVSDRIPLVSTNSVEGIAWSPRGDIALVALLRPKNLITATQVAQGWMITNGLAVIRAAQGGEVVQVLLDDMNAYFADPFGVVFSPDGAEAYVTTTGANKVSVIDLGSLKRVLDAASSEDRLHRLPNDLGLSSEYVVARIPVGNAPKGMAVSGDGSLLYVAEHLTDRVSVIDIRRRAVTGSIDLGGPRTVSLRRRGEQVFNGVTATFQGQFSCQSCHPDGGVDGLSYDLEPDGLGSNLVDNRSLRGIAGTAPFKWSGVTPDLKTQCGMRFAKFITRSSGFSPDDLEALVTYLKSIPLFPNRYRTRDGSLTPGQERGKLIFDRAITNDRRPIPLESRCVTCHPPPLYTSGKSFDVGTRKWYDTSGNFDTPQLSNVYDTAPFLHDGSAATLEEIWTVYGTEERHGFVNDLSKQQFNDLVEYLKTL